MKRLLVHMKQRVDPGKAGHATAVINTQERIPLCHSVSLAYEDVSPDLSSCLDQLHMEAEAMAVSLRSSVHMKGRRALSILAQVGMLSSDSTKLWA